MASGEAIAIFIIGAIFGILIIVGAVLQYSEEKSRVGQTPFSY
jgi:uncharacterized membrane protein